jgi:hypothetical protein
MDMIVFYEALGMISSCFIVEGRTALFNINMRGINVDADVKAEELAKLTEGYSGADITIVCRDACLMVCVFEALYMYVCMYECMDGLLGLCINGDSSFDAQSKTKNIFNIVKFFFFLLFATHTIGSRCVEPLRARHPSRSASFPKV